jgi:hypothetical protein
MECAAIDNRNRNVGGRRERCGPRSRFGRLRRSPTVGRVTDGCAETVLRFVPSTHSVSPTLKTFRDGQPTPSFCPSLSP